MFPCEPSDYVCRVRLNNCHFRQWINTKCFTCLNNSAISVMPESLSYSKFNSQLTENRPSHFIDSFRVVASLHRKRLDQDDGES